MVGFRNRLVEAVAKRIRTEGEVPFEVALTDPPDPPSYLKIVEDANRLKQVINANRIAVLLKVNRTTVVRALRAVKSRRDLAE